MRLPEHNNRVRFNRRTLDRAYGEFDKTPQPLPPQLVDFLNRHGVAGKVSPDMLWPIEPQILGHTDSRIPFPVYREPYAEYDFSPEVGPLPRLLHHFCLCPSTGGGWFYLLALFEIGDLSEIEKMNKIIARLNEKPIP